MSPNSNGTTSDVGAGSIDLALNIENLKFAYRKGGAGFGLSIPSLRIKRGERIALLGPSGSGKSTLLGLIAGVLHPQSGTLEVMGKNLNSLNGRQRDRFRSDTMGILFQQFNLLPYLSVVDNVILPLAFSKHKHLSKAEKYGKAHALLSALDMEPQQFAGKPVSLLSVGQQQRVAAARAFVGEASLIIADEPTSALDEGRQQEFLDLLFKQADKTNATLLLVTHDSRIAARFERVLDLSQVCQPLEAMAA